MHSSLHTDNTPSKVATRFMQTQNVSRTMDSTLDGLFYRDQALMEVV